ncbi:Amidase 1 [Grifola frondosa]|uniref:Amidase 1 n=1 Tax=Grifola frondosa TaxID=5627 RepID=A0A1C7LYE1_GRIFR|nr:Amidase 1 [Grifola frondosa]
MKITTRALITVVASSLIAAVQVQLQLKGETLTLGNISYFVPPSPVARLQTDLVPFVGKTIAAENLVPFSVISTSQVVFDDSALEALVQSWSVKDDVWTQYFLNGIFVAFNGSHRSPSISLSSTEKKFTIQFVLGSKSYLEGISISTSLPSGPYFLEPSTGSIFKHIVSTTTKTSHSCMGTIPDGSEGFQVLSAHIPGAATPTIGVPSRLYFIPTAEKPLAGPAHRLRQSRVLGALSPADAYRTRRAAPARRGLVLVGKTKTSQFANGEGATDDWVDLHAPYNPRGDGYQDGSSSSTGSGTAVAAYPWLDFAIGSDTGGSMRGPAGANGVFGNRPSHGAVLLDDVMPLSPELDTGGIFSRDAKMWAVAGHWWYQNFTTYPQFPKTILFPVDFFGSSYLTEPPAAGTVAATFNMFITKLEAFLGTTRTEINLTDMWNITKPANASAPSLRVLLNTTYADLITTDQIALVADPFIADYGAANGGRMPFIDPAPLTRWTYGRSLPAGRHDEAVANKTIFMDWFASEVVKGGVVDTCSESIFLYPQSSGGTNYRNRYIGPPSTPFGFSAGRIAVHAETPDMVVPVGEAPYNSTITGKMEVLPVTLSFVAAKNCDLMLFNLFAALQDAGIINTVKTGSNVLKSSSRQT